jgi:hypothetical protein
MKTMDQAIAALEANEADAHAGRVSFPEFAARRAALDAELAAATTAACIRHAKTAARNLSTGV